MAMPVVYSPECLGYEIPGHPESPERVRRIFEALDERGFRFTTAGPAKEEDILLAHSKEHLERVRSRSYSDADTPPVDILYPLVAAGVTMKASQKLGFALTRPPGHHAGKNFLEGFCYFNNVAISVKKMNKRAAVLDLDVHHGNGTQDIFLGDENVIYVSLHQVPLYPMTGTRSEKNCHNFPLAPGTSENAYLKALGKALLLVEKFRPEILAVSMGFDTYAGDPLSNQMVSKRGYEKVGEMVRNLNLPTFVALEGGYSKMIGDLSYNFLKSF